MTVDVLARHLPPGVRVHGEAHETDRTTRWREWLSDEERACIKSFGAAVRRREFLTGRAAARHLLADVLGTSPSQVPLRRADDGAVDVVGTDWHVSIAHSDERALAAASRRPVGVDLERIRPRDPAVTRFLLHPEERELLDTLPYGENRSLLLCWTLKEAALKARRSGFQTSPTALRLRVAPAGQAATATMEGGRQWQLVYAELDGFWAAVATPEPGD